MTTRAASREIAAVFFRLGLTSFGGPVAHIAIMRHEIVARRGWLTDDEFLDLVAATHLIPGPNSTELAIHIGYRRGGWPGLIVAGACFIFPAAVIVAALAALYARYGETPQVGWLLYGIHPVIIGIVAFSMAEFAPGIVKRLVPAVIALAVAAFALRGADELFLLAAGGAAGLLTKLRPRIPRVAACLVVAGFAASLSAAAQNAAAQVPVTLPRLTLFFLKAGSVLFGSGYVLLAFLRADLVERWHWLTDQQMVDAIAVGQVTPGPVFTTATFIGYLLQGWSGAALATVAIFLPAFVFVALSHPYIGRMRRSARLAGLLDGLVAASLGLMAAVAWELGRSSIVDSITAAIAIVTVGLLVARVNSAWLVVAGGIAGWLFK